MIEEKSFIMIQEIIDEIRPGYKFKNEIEEKKLNQLLLQKMFKLKTIWLKLMKNILVKLQNMII